MTYSGLIVSDELALGRNASKLDCKMYTGSGIIPPLLVGRMIRWLDSGAAASDVVRVKVLEVNLQRRRIAVSRKMAIGSDGG